MKVLMINGSPHENGCTKRALKEVAAALKDEGVDSVFLDVGAGNRVKHGCLACGGCSVSHRCVIDDSVNDAIDIMKDCDGVVIGSPVYFASANGTMISFLDRLFCANRSIFEHKIGASVVSARRGGNSATFDELNKYLLISNMFVAGSNYWNQVHGNSPAEVEQDLEGLQTMRLLGRNMAYFLKVTAESKIAKPAAEKKIKTNFAR
ncbi:MAG: flavodoxin family protein [Bacillota bacterium]|nr:MAG: flavodoxin family protein [Bacillota bacterium]